MVKILAKIGKQLQKVAGSIGEKMEDYDHVIREGTYGRKSEFVKLLMGQSNQKNKRSVHAVVGQKAMNAISSVLSSVGGKLLLGIAAAAVVSTTVAVGVALGIGAAILGAGSLWLYRNYVRAKERSQDVIEEINLAGQKVKGTRADLCRLRDMYIHLQNVENYVPEASTKSPEHLRAELLNDVADEINRVQVLDAGSSGASAEAYSLPELDNRFASSPAIVVAEEASKLSNMSLVQGWRARQGVTSSVEVVAPAPVNNKRAANTVTVATVAPKPVTAS